MAKEPCELCGTKARLHDVAIEVLRDGEPTIKICRYCNECRTHTRVMEWDSIRGRQKTAGNLPSNRTEPLAVERRHCNKCGNITLIEATEDNGWDGTVVVFCPSCRPKAARATQQNGG